MDYFNDWNSQYNINARNDKEQWLHLQHLFKKADNQFSDRFASRTSRTRCLTKTIPLQIAVIKNLPTGYFLTFLKIWNKTGTRIRNQRI